MNRPATQRVQSAHDETLQEAYFGHAHTTVIEPTRGWRMLDWRELWAYRELLWAPTMRDIKVL